MTKGRGDCGNHEWYKSSDAEDRCYHCWVGVRRPSRFVEHADKEIIDLLRSRDSIETEVRLRDGRSISVFDIVWGYDIGDAYAHVSTNASPQHAGREFDLIFTNEIEQLVDPSTGLVLFDAPRSE